MARNKQITKEINGALTYVGDPWTIASFIGKKEKIPSETMKQAFRDVRREMLHGEASISKNAKLAKTISDLRQYKVLMTNTEETSGKEFLDYLMLHDCFQELHFDGKKPNGMRQLLKSLRNRGFKSTEILAIGDNPFNDLHPLKQIGGYTCLISNYAIADHTEWSKHLHTIDELEAFLSLFIHAKTGKNTKVMN